MFIRDLIDSKTANSIRSRGIRHITNPVEVDRKSRRRMIAQKYLHTLILLHGRKIKLVRLIVLTTSFSPLQFYIYNQGVTKLSRNNFTLDPFTFHACAGIMTLKDARM